MVTMGNKHGPAGGGLKRGKNQVSIKEVAVFCNGVCLIARYESSHNIRLASHCFLLDPIKAIISNRTYKDGVIFI